MYQDRIFFWKNVDTILVSICCLVGVGSILFGSLSGDDDGYYFVVFGVLSLILAGIHSVRTAKRYKEIMNL
jgi:hypothetical protein